MRVDEADANAVEAMPLDQVPHLVIACRHRTRQTVERIEDLRTLAE